MLRASLVIVARSPSIGNTMIDKYIEIRITLSPLLSAFFHLQTPTNCKKRLTDRL